jgi:PAS domain S-box-containing protein
MLNSESEKKPIEKLKTEPSQIKKSEGGSRGFGESVPGEETPGKQGWFRRTKGRQEFEGQKLRYRIGLIAVFMAGSCLILYYFHAFLGTGNIVAHMFYIPIILAAVWWGKKGIIVAAFSSIFLVFSHIVLFFNVANSEDYFRALMFMVVACVVAELSERITKRKEEAIRSEEFLTNIINTLDDPVFVKDQNHRWFILNDAACQVMGRPREELIGKSDYDLFPKEQADVFWEKDNLVLETGQTDVNEEKITWHGKLHTISTKKSLFTDSITSKSYIAGTIRDITELKQSEETLRESEGKLTAMLESLADPMSMMDKDLNIIWANETAMNIFGDDIVGRKCYEAYHRGKEPCEPYPCLTLKVFQDGKIHEHDTQVVDKGGNTRYFHCSANVALRDEQGNPTSVLEISEDITNRRLAEEALRESESSYRAVVENTTEGIIVVQGQTLQFVNPAIVSIMGYSEKEMLTRPFIEFVHPDHRKWAMGIHMKRLKGEEVPSVYEIKVLDSKGKVKWLENSGILIEWRDKPATLNFIRDITEQKRAKEELKASKEFLENVIETANALIIVLDPDGNITTFNRFAEQLTGYRKDEVLGRNWFELFIPEDEAENIRSVHKNVLQDKLEVSSYENFMDTKKGQKRLISWNNQSAKDNEGKAIATISIGIDITQRKKAEEEIRKFKTLADRAGYGVGISDIDGNVIYVNSSFLEMHGYADNEFVGKNFSVFHNEEQMINVNRINEKFRKEGNYVAEEVWHKRKDGSVFPTLMNGTLIYDEKGKPRFIGVTALDITASKKTEEELRIKENAIASSINAIAIAEFLGGLTYVNKAFLRMWGYDDENEVLGRPTLGFWQSKEKAQEVIEELQRGESVIGELVARRKDGSLFDVQLSACAVTDESGSPVCMMASFMDITERKKAEEALRESENKYRAVVDNAIEGIVVVQDGMLKFVNPKLISVVGYSIKELTSRPFIEFIHPDYREQVMGIHINRLKGEEVPTIYEFKVFDKKGNAIWVENSGILIEWGGRPATLNFLRDISERKEAEQAIWASESEKKSILNAISDQILFHGTDLSIRWCNEAAARSVGMAQKEMVGRHCYELWQGRSEPCEGCPVLRAIKTDSYSAGITKTPDGKYWEIVGEPVRERDGEVRGAIEISRDITERKKAEESLKYRMEFEQLITILSKGFIDPGAIHEKINEALKIIGEFAKVDRAYVFQLSEGGRTADNTHEWCAEGIQPQIENLKGIALDEELPWFWEKIKAHDTFHVPSVAELPPEAHLEKKHFEKQDIQAIVVVPMLSKGLLRGFLGFDSIRSRKTWPEDIITLLSISGEGISLALDREHAEQRARLLSSTVEQSSEGMAVVDLKGNLLFLNNTFAAMHGYTPEELIGRHISVFHTPEQLLTVQAGIRQAKETGDFNGEVWHVRRDGEVFPGLMHNSLLRNEKCEPIGMIGTLRDITESKKAEQSLKESEIMFRSLTEDSLVGVYLIQDGIFKYVNPKFAETFGYSVDELIGTKGPDKIVFSEDWPISKENLRRRLEGEVKSIQYSFRGVTKDKKIIYVEVYGSGTQYQGRPAVIGTLLDITERRYADEALQESELKFKSIFENAGGAIFIANRKTGEILECNTQAEVLLGRTRAEIIGMHQTDLHPRGEEEKYKKKFAAHVRKGHAVDFEGEIQHMDGRMIPVWISAQSLVIGDKDVILGLFVNITERKKVESKLIEYQEQLKSLASQLSLIEERERRHIATELHDQISQSLVISKIKLDSMRESVSPGESKKVLKEVCNCLEQVIQDTRTLTFDLSYPILYELGFEAAVAEWLDEEIRQKHGIKTEFQDDEHKKPLDEDIRALLFRNVRELLINVVKHAKAKKVKVSIRKWNNDICVIVDDNGVGFDVSQIESLVTKKAQFGLFSIRERLESLGGHFEIKSKVGRGSKITMKAPLKYQKTTNGAQV